MARCAKCGAQLPENAKFCPECGQPASRSGSGAQEQNDADVWATWWAEREKRIDDGHLDVLMRQDEWWRSRPKERSYGDWLSALSPEEHQELLERVGRHYLHDALRGELEE